MRSLSFAVNWDYRCPFARNAHEHLVAALEGGADWEVAFVPFSLSQIHVEEGQPSVWDDPEKASHLLAMQAGIVVRDRYPEAFHAVHLGLFRARHDESRDLREEAEVRRVLADQGVDPNEIMAQIAEGWPLEAFRKAHESSVNDHQAFGVPTFMVGEQAVFVRLMTRPDGDAEASRSAIEHVVTLAQSRPELNEFKHTSIFR
jgi:protein-disulfide isomerase-like protein with CxxC motif